LNDPDHNFRERFDTAATVIVLAIITLASAAWIESAIRRLYRVHRQSKDGRHHRRGD
jgi:HAMP domain-containing protein